MTLDELCKKLISIGRFRGVAVYKAEAISETSAAFSLSVDNPVFDGPQAQYVTTKFDQDAFKADFRDWLVSQLPHLQVPDVDRIFLHGGMTIFKPRDEPSEDADE